MRKDRIQTHGRKFSIHLTTLQYEAEKKRALGPSAFVEMAMLERVVLTTEKELAKMVQDCAERKAQVAKVIKKCNLVSNFMVLMTYWGVAMVAIDGSRLYGNNNQSPDEVVTDVGQASEFWKGFLFPMSYSMMAYKMTEFGVEKEMRPSCLGALAVFWAAQVTCGEIVDCALQWMAA